jgi:5-methyltetrahydropteroyltriglutamate--homocysteine methyltransferase
VITSYQYGIYPRSEALVAATRDLDRGRTTPGAVRAQQDEDLAAFVDVQREAGLDLFSDGLLRWQDLFRPLVEASTGLEPGALVRWFDTNTFYRAPEAHEDVALDRGLGADFDTSDAVPAPRVATLPSPLLLSRVAVTKGAPNDFMVEAARNVLRPAAEWFVSKGAGLVHLQEPWLAFHGAEDADWKPFEESIRLIADGLGAPVVLHTYWGDGAAHADRLRDLPVDAVGFDFSETDVDALGTNWPTGVLVGCVSGRRSVLESVDGIVAFVRRVADTLQPPRLYVSSVSDLELLPRDLAAEKVRRMGAAAARLKESDR